MTSATLVQVDTYLRTMYRPDCDYIDGEVLQRNVGEIPHSRLLGYVVGFFVKNRAEWRLEALPSVRVQVGPTRFRVPDVTVIPTNSGDRSIVQSTPVLCVEIFSSEDRMSRMEERVADYQRMGVAAVWALDPWRRVAYVGGPGGKLIAEGDSLAVVGTPVAVTVEEGFAELDRLA